MCLTCWPSSLIPTTTFSSTEKTLSRRAHDDSRPARRLQVRVPDRELLRQRCARVRQLSFRRAPAFDVKECQLRGVTYSAPISRVKVRLIIYDKEVSRTPKPIKDIQASRKSIMGEIPLMTENGTFVVNGTERVIVSQLHRSLRACSSITTRARAHSSGKLLYSARVIPYRGSWLDFEFDPKDNVFVRIDRRRKLPASRCMLRALGMSAEEILDEFFDTSDLPPLRQSPASRWSLVPSRLAWRDRDL